ncbi:MAG: TFIIB-type zinc ribbon-containing protein [Planctomycetaceae bacterium]
MPIDVACPQCGHSYQVRDEAAGRQFKCKSCGDVVSVPGLAIDAGHSASPVDADKSDEPRAPVPRRSTFGEIADEVVTDGRVWLAKASLVLGCIVWCLIIVGFLAMMVLGLLASRQGAGRPDDQQMMTVAMIAMGICGVGCLGLVLALIGLSLGVIALTTPAEPRGQSIGGLVLNSLYLVGTAILVLIVTLARQV